MEIVEGMDLRHSRCKMFPGAGNITRLEAAIANGRVVSTTDSRWGTSLVPFNLN